jgi:hypothetical protein
MSLCPGNEGGDNRFTVIKLAPARKRNYVIYAMLRTREAGKWDC